MLSNASGVSLLPDYAKIFDNANKKNNEIIFSFYFERYETGNLWMGTYTTSRTDNLSMAVNLDGGCYFSQSEPPRLCAQQ